MHDHDIIDIAEQQTAWGEPPTLDQRVIVAPRQGRFEPLPAEIFTSEGEWVEPGTVMARIVEGTLATEVRSNARGWVMGMLAFPGHTVRRGEALFWLRID